MTAINCPHCGGEIQLSADADKKLVVTPGNKPAPKPAKPDSGNPIIDAILSDDEDGE